MRMVHCSCANQGMFAALTRAARGLRKKLATGAPPDLSREKAGEVTEVGTARAPGLSA